MDQLEALGRGIGPSLFQTHKIYTGLLQDNQKQITSIPRKTHSYGPTPRHQLDIYEPNSITDDTAIFIFLYGGGLAQGDRIVGSPLSSGDLIYHNLGYYFADHGFVTVIPDYRRTGEGATFPSGGEDVKGVLTWLNNYVNNDARLSKGKKQRKVYIMGNSAGGIHAATFLLAPQFARDIEVLTSQKIRLILDGVVLVSPACAFGKADSSRTEVLQQYYKDRIGEDSPLGLLKATKEIPPVRVLLVSAELDPEDEIIETCQAFAHEWRVKFGVNQTKFEVVELDGHNHFSTVLGLGTGIEEEESLGETVTSWIEVRPVRIRTLSQLSSKIEPDDDDDEE